jgi:hypothetical protein
MLDLDELKQKWVEHDRKLDESIRLNQKLLSALTLNRTRSALHRLVVVLGVESLFGLAVAVALGNFIYEHIATLRLALPAIALHGFVIVSLIGLIRQIVKAVQVDYGRPVANIQQQLAALRMSTIRTTQWVLLAGMLAWTPFVIVASQGFFGIDAYRTFGATWLWANFLFSVAVIGLAIWLSKRFSARLGRSPFMQRLMRDLAGYNLNKAAGLLASIREFQEEGPAADR